jgi:hypothetical protein
MKNCREPLCHALEDASSQGRRANKRQAALSVILTTTKKRKEKKIVFISVNSVQIGAL